MTLTSSELTRELTLFEFAPGKKAAWGTLRRMIPDTESALFFGRAYGMKYDALSTLVHTLFDTTVLRLLGNGNHSVALQEYCESVIPPLALEKADPNYVEAVPHAEFLPELWEAFSITVAKSISEVADKLGNVLDSLPSKEGQMTFQSLRKMNRQRPTIGAVNTVIRHRSVPNALVIFDVSGSMTEQTVTGLIDEVVALAWKANASLAIVSNSCFVWGPGTYNTKDVLKKAEYGGTQYEKLAPLFEQDWGTVITIADYDSSWGAKEAIALKPGRIGKVLDLSLVNRPTFLAECVGQLADEVEPMLVATSRYVLA